jgi:hypothetical protein
MLLPASSQAVETISPTTSGELQFPLVMGNLAFMVYRERRHRRRSSNKSRGGAERVFADRGPGVQK